MSWFNYYGLIILCIMMVPNIIDAKLHPEHFTNHFNNKALEILEQTGRIGSFVFSVFNIPFVYGGFWIDGGLIVYLSVNAVLLVFYLLGWLVFRKNRSVFRAYYLSVIPSIIFIFSGVILMNYPLILFSVLFAICHISVSVKNAKAGDEAKE